MSDFFTEIAPNRVSCYPDFVGSEEEWIEKPIIFRNSNENRLFGMIYRPRKLLPTRRVGILICVNSVKYRIGSFRYHTMLARHLSQNGYYVMTFDPEGIGDSEGVFEEKYLFEHYCDIQKGKFSDDIIDAVTIFRSQNKLDEVVLLGLCGGAISSLITSSKQKEIAGLILLGLPVLLDFVGEKKEKFDKSSMITSKKYAVSVLLPMLKKLIDIETWANIFNGKVQWRGELKFFFKAIKVIVVENFKRLIFWRKRDNKSKHPRYNPIFHQTILDYFSSKRKVLFVFGELDHMTWVFKSEFQDRFLAPPNSYEKLYEIYIVEKANHIFTSRESQVKLNKILGRWLRVHFSLS